MPTTYLPVPEFIAGEPPKKRNTGRPGVWCDRLAPLLAVPGVWAIVARGTKPSSSTASGINKGTVGGYPAGTFEAVSRSVEGEHRLYVRAVAQPAVAAA